MNHRMHKTLLATIVAAACATLVPVVASAQEPAAKKEMKSTMKHHAGDATALAVVATVDQDEIDAAKLAQSKKVSGPVADYAKMMIDDHTKNLADTKKLSHGAMKKDAKAEMQHKEDAAMMAKLKPLEGKAFEKAYVDGMVEGHGKVLAKLDGELIPAASDAKVKTHLTMTRDAVSKHLDHAKKLQQGMK